MQVQIGAEFGVCQFRLMAIADRGDGLLARTSGGGSSSGGDSTVAARDRIDKTSNVFREHLSPRCALIYVWQDSFQVLLEQRSVMVHINSLLNVLLCMLVYVLPCELLSVLLRVLSTCELLLLLAMLQHDPCIGAAAATDVAVIIHYY